MKRRFKYLALQEAKRNGAFGDYLTMPATDKTRTAIIGKRLAFLRAEAQLSQQDVCEIIGVAKTSYSGYELGQHEPTCEIICRLAELYKIETDFILGLGCVDPDSEEIMEHYLKCKGYEDLEMTSLAESMALIAVKQAEIEKEE